MTGFVQLFGKETEVVVQHRFSAPESDGDFLSCRSEFSQLRGIIKPLSGCYFIGGTSSHSAALTAE
jgi:hypothetical protein